MRDTMNLKLISRYLSGECTNEERKRVEAWIKATPEHRRMIKLLTIAWQSQEVRPAPSNIEDIFHKMTVKAGITELPEIHTEKPTQKHSAKIYTWHDRVLSANRILRVAAVISLVLGISYFGLWRAGFIPGIDGWIHITRTVENGKRLKITLSDGTRVTLDAGSRFKYPKKFSDDTREVYLNGEGYFEVAHDSRKTFVVHAMDTRIHVLGTKFNVRAWDRTEKVVVAVKEGKVAFGLNRMNNAEKVILTQGHLSRIERGGAPSLPEIIDVDQYLGWMNNEIVFENTKLSEILSQLERWYDFRFVISDSSIMNERLNIHIQGESVGDVLDLVSLLTGLSYERRGDQIRLTIDN